MNKLYTFVIILNLLVAPNLYSQTTDALDEKNGFQNFKFNTKLSNYTKYGPKEIKSGEYLLQNISDVVIGDYSIEKLELHFRDDLLIRVSILLDDQDRTKSEIIYQGLVKNYGKQTSKNTSSVIGTYAQNMIWKGNSVSLTFKLVSYREGSLFLTKIYLIYQLDRQLKDVSDYL